VGTAVSSHSAALRPVAQQHGAGVAPFVLAVEEQRLRHAGPRAAQRHLRQQHPVRAAVGPVQAGAEERLAPEQAEEVLALVAGVDQRGEAPRRARRVDPGEDVAVGAAHLVPGADLRDPGGAQHRPRRRLERGHGAGQVAGREAVVVRRPLEVRAAREAKQRS
jgi:hypothetical protein